MPIVAKFPFNIWKIGERKNGNAVCVLYTHRTQYSKQSHKGSIVPIEPLQECAYNGTHLDSPREGLSCISIYFSLQYFKILKIYL